MVVLAVVLCGGTSALGAGAARPRPALADAAHLLLRFSLVALGDLVEHSDEVDASVTADDIPTARAGAVHLAGRGTEPMDGPACRRSASESLGESLVDGIVSPIF